MGWAVDAPRVDSPIVIDGRLDEAAWGHATPITEFHRFAPTAGGAPPGPTEVRVIHDGETLYVGVHVDEARPVRYRWAPREDIEQDDRIAVLLDTFREGHAGYVFTFNALGVQQDERVSSGRRSPEWDAVLDAVGVVDGAGWDLEVAIPFSSLRYPATAGMQEWGLVVQRIDAGDQSEYSAPETERDDPALFSKAAPLRLEPPRTGGGVELIPSLTAVQQAVPGEERVTWTGVSHPLQAFRPSLDVRVGLTPNIGLTATANPDFSQVENDETPIELNERFAFWFPERRPFFLDGADLFEDRAGLLYSRSIVEPIGGIKVGGKEGPVSVALLTALDRAPAPSVHEHGTPGFDAEDVVDAWAADTVARVATEAFGSGTVGVSFADKRIVHSGSGQPGGVNDAWVVDAYVPLPRRWVVAGSATASLTGDGVAALRPGIGVEGRIARESGVGTGGYVAATANHRDLRLENGYLPQTGVVDVEAGLDHTFEPGIVDTVTPGLDAQMHLEEDGDGWGGAQVTGQLQAGANSFDAFVGWVRNSEAGLVVDGAYGGGSWWSRPTGWLELNPSGWTSRVIDYERLVPAQVSGADLPVTLWPTRHLRVDATLALRWLAPEGDALEHSARLRGKVGYQFTRTLGARVIAEYATGTDLGEQLTGSVLLTWLVHPGTGVWVGYAETGPLDHRGVTASRTAFAKVSVLLRPPTHRKVP